MHQDFCFCTNFMSKNWIFCVYYFRLLIIFWWLQIMNWQLNLISWSSNGNWTFRPSLSWSEVHWQQTLIQGSFNLKDFSRKFFNFSRTEDYWGWIGHILLNTHLPIIQNTHKSWRKVTRLCRNCMEVGHSLICISRFSLTLSYYYMYMGKIHF